VKTVQWRELVDEESVTFAANRESTLVDPFRDENLEDALARPFLIHQQEFTNLSLLDTVLFDPAKMLLEQPMIAAILKYYRYFRAGIQLRLSVNGSPYVYGRSVLCYIPYGRITDWPWQRWVQNRPTKIDYTDNHTVEVGWGWQSPLDWHDMDGDDFDWGMAAIVPLTQLRTSQQTTARVTISVYAHFVNPKVAGHRNVPRVAEAHGRVKKRTIAPDGVPIRRTYTPQQDPVHQEADRKTSSGTLSGIARATSAIAPLLAPLPFVGNVASVVGPVAGVIGPLLEGLGLAKPNLMPSPVPIYQYAGRELFHVSGGSQPVRVCLDPDQHLASGVTPESGWDLRKIAQVPCVIHRTTIAQNTAPSNTVPLVSIPTTPITEFGGHSTPMKFAADVFHYWRGSLKYQIEFICSRFTTARFVIRWYPSAESSIQDENAITSVVDIEGTTDARVVIPFLWPRRWKGGSDGTGTLSIYLLNSIVGNDPEVVAPIDVLIWGAMGPDVQFHAFSLPPGPEIKQAEAEGYWEDFEEEFESLGTAASGVFENAFCADEQVYDVVTLGKQYNRGEWPKILDRMFLFFRGSMRYAYIQETQLSTGIHTAIFPYDVHFYNQAIPVATVEVPMYSSLPYFTKVPHLANVADPEQRNQNTSAASTYAKLYAFAEDVEYGWFIGVPGLPFSFDDSPLTEPAPEPEFLNPLPRALKTSDAVEGSKGNRPTVSIRSGKE